MPMTPQFSPGHTGVLFFSRGRGRGHAVADMAIVEELSRLVADVDVRFVSYATGSDTLTEFGHTVIDLDLPEANPVIETLVRAARVIGWLSPHLVVAHEEFTALPAAKIFGLPALFITDWFVEPEKFSMKLLHYADEVIFTDEPGTFDEPAYLDGKVHYVGPVMRPFSYGRKDRCKARDELDLPQEASVISVLPGAWTEQRTPISDLVLPAFESLEAPSKFLIWLAGADCDLLREKTRNTSGIIVKEKDWQIDRLMVASDVAITKANRKTAMELAALGIPSISLSYGLNPTDDARVELIATNTALKAKEIDSNLLADCISKLLRANRQAAEPSAPPFRMDGRKAAAQRLACHIENLRAGDDQASNAPDSR